MSQNKTRILTSQDIDYLGKRTERTVVVCVALISTLLGFSCHEGVRCASYENCLRAQESNESVVCEQPT